MYRLIRRAPEGQEGCEWLGGHWVVMLRRAPNVSGNAVL